MRQVATVLAALLWPGAAFAEVSFRFPGSDEHRQHFYITAYRDVTGSSGGRQDWSCGDRTYAGHRGTDMGVGSFPGMDAGRDVVAAAPGVVTAVYDGAFDRCTTGNCAGGAGFGNYVRLDHADGKVTYYAHLKKFSITVAVGDEVSCGQTIGQVGSSGFSTGPHLHFEPRVNGVSDDPFAGPCGGPISWWVDQGEYLGLPETTCGARAHPLLTMDAGLDPIEGQVPDARPDGDSAGIFDLFPGQSVTARFQVTADPAGPRSPNVVLGIEVPGGFLRVLDWEVLDDHPGNACEGSFCPNDANDNPRNPPRERPGESLEIHLNAMSPGESKLLLLTLAHQAPTEGAPPHAVVQVWVKEVEGTYAKSSFDALPENVDGAQTFNDGDLRQELILDTWSAAGPPPPDDGALGGGCAVSGRGAAPWAVLLAALALALARRRRRLG